MKFNMRKLKYGSASVIFTALVIAIVIILNIVAQIVSDRFSLKIDMTEEGQFSLSESTLKMLDGIEDEINIYILSTEVNMEKSDQSQRALEMIQRYNTHSGGKVRYQFIDPNKNPQFFEKYQKAIGAQPKALVVEGKERYTVIESSQFAYYYGDGSQNDANKIYYQSEELLSSAILYVSSLETSNAGFVTGHDEEALSALKNIFKGNNFEVSNVNLLNGVSAEINNLVISAPKSDFTADEITALDNYLKIDGNNLYVFWGFETPTLPALERYLAEWGFEFPSYLVCDESASYAGQPVFVISELPMTELTKNGIINRELQGDKVLILPRTRPINLLFDKKSFNQVLPIMETAKSAYGKLISADNQLKTVNRESGDIPGPFVTGAVGMRALGNNGNQGYAQVFVFGSQGFAADEIMEISHAYNDELLTELITYANPDTNVMTIKPKVTNKYDLNVTTTEARIFSVLLFVFPVLLLIAGIVVFIARRRK